MRNVMRAAISGVTAVAAAMTISLIYATPAEAAPPRIEITKLYYDSPGSDSGSNASLNAEYVRLTNRRDYAINLKGWTIRDRANHIYRFTTDFRLQPGANVYIHTGTGSNTTGHRYWGQGRYVWNNTGDKAYVRTPGGTLVDSCTWGDGKGYTWCS
jgi:hypothetical protein